MKKILIVLCVFFLVGCSQKEKAIYADGTFSGEGNGMGGTIQVSIEIENSKIISITTISHGETESYYKEIEEKLYPVVIENNSAADIDIVTGATVSSNGAIEAINEALNASRNELSEK